MPPTRSKSAEAGVTTREWKCLECHISFSTITDMDAHKCRPGASKRAAEKDKIEKDKKHKKHQAIRGAGKKALQKKKTK